MSGITPNHIWHENAITEVRALAKVKQRDALAYRRAAEDMSSPADSRRRWLLTAEDRELEFKSLQEMADGAARQRCLMTCRWILRANEKGDVTPETLEALRDTIDTCGEVILNEEREFDGAEVSVVVVYFADPQTGMERWAVSYEGAKRSLTDHATLFDAQTRAEELLAALDALA